MCGRRASVCASLLNNRSLGILTVTADPAVTSFPGRALPSGNRS
jgi:hypothetical protein